MPRTGLGRAGSVPARTEALLQGYARPRSHRTPPARRRPTGRRAVCRVGAVPRVGAARRAGAVGRVGVSAGRGPSAGAGLWAGSECPPSGSRLPGRSVRGAGAVGRVGAVCRGVAVRRAGAVCQVGPVRRGGPFAGRGAVGGERPPPGRDAPGGRQRVWVPMWGDLPFSRTGPPTHDGGLGDEFRRPTAEDRRFGPCASTNLPALRPTPRIMTRRACRPPTPSRDGARAAPQW